MITGLKSLPHSTMAGRHRGELVLSLNRAEKILKSEDRSEMTSFLKNIELLHSDSRKKHQRIIG